MKKIWILMLILIIFGVFPILTVRADFGPKSAVTIDIIGINKPYFFELLYEDALPIESEREDAYQLAIESGMMEQSFFPEMVKDFSEDGFISSLLYRDRPTVPYEIEEHSFRYTYIPPQTFKLILIFEDSTYLTSPIITTKLFNSHVTWDLANVNTSMIQSNIGVIEEDIPFFQMSSDLLIRIIVTIGVELLILLAFKYRLKKSYLLVLGVNLFTQTALTVFMFLMRYYFMPYFGEIIGLTIGEFLIFFIEIIIFMKFLKEKSSKRAFGYAMIANIASLILGFILMLIFWL
ncbi:MAG: hypothetical protein JXC35_01310 [Acholeplasmataceae bacterium]|nr:hypothetical protein [Acholeplasmataceae bacterium]